MVKMKSLISLTALIYVATARPGLHTLSGRRIHHPRAQFDLSPSAVSYIQSAITSAGLPPCVTPSLDDQITEWNGLGDSFASGIGSNAPNDYDSNSKDCQRYRLAYSSQMNDRSDAWPGNKGSRKYTLGACSAATMEELRNFQLSPQPVSNGNKRPFPAFGKPQLTVMNIGGVDLGFGNIISSCVMGYPSTSSCVDFYTDAITKLNSDEFIQEIGSTLIAVLKAGQQAGGTSPPEKYQLFVNGYVPFFNGEDPSCNTVSWGAGHTVFGNYLFTGINLTTEWRGIYNGLVNGLNERSKAVANLLEPYGVNWVEGWQVSYNGHMFCDSKVDTNLKEPTSPNTWFWQYYSPWGNEGYATDADKNTTDDDFLNYLFPDPTIRDQVFQSGKVPDGFENDERFLAVLAAFRDRPQPEVTSGPAVLTGRIFHPKGTALGVQADFNVGYVLSRRMGAIGSNAGSITCNQGDNIQKSDVQAAIQTIKDKGDNDGKNNCCSGSNAVVCAPFLAQSGTASISLCGVANQCIGCGQLGSLLDPLVSKCFNGDTGAVFSANTTIPGHDGLYAVVRFASGAS